MSLLLLFRNNSTPASVTITTTGSTFNPTVELVGGSTATLTWTASTGTVLTGLSPSFSFGSAATRTVTLTASGGGGLGDITTFNIGFDNSQDTGTYAVGAGYNKTSQSVSAVSNVKAMTGLVRFLAAGITGLTSSIDFSGMSSLQFIECFGSSLTGVTLTGCTSLKRLCIEGNNVSTLDLNPVAANLLDLRAAAQQGGTLTLTTLTSNLASLYHFCTRDQTVVGHPPFSRLPVLEQLWTWNTGQTGALNPVSTVLSDIRAYGNSYSSANLSSSTALGYVDLHSNSFGQTAVDNILTTVNGFGTSSGFLDLTFNSAPSSTGTTARSSLISRSWTVNVTVASGVHSDDFQRANATGLAAVGNGWYSPGSGTANIVSGDLVRTDSAGYQLVLNPAGADLDADYTVTASIPGTFIGSTFFGIVGRWDGAHGVAAFFGSGGTSFSDLVIHDAVGYLSSAVTVTADNAFPASWSNTAIDHTFAMKMTGSLIEVYLDGTLVAHATMTLNATKTGTGYGINGEGQSRAWHSIGTIPAGPTPISAADTATATESTSRAVSFAQSDDTGLTDQGSTAVGNVYTLTVSDSVGEIDCLDFNPTTPVSSSDTGSSSEAATLSVIATGDTASVVDAATLAVTTTDSDTATSTDALTSRSIASADTASAAEATSTAVTTSASDAGSSTEATALAVTTSSSDTAASIDAVTSLAVIALGDTGSSAEGTASIAQSSSDAGSGIEGTPAVAQSVSDTGGGTEAASLAANASGSDTAVGNDAAALAVTTSSSDTGFGAEARVLDAAVVTADPTGLTDSADTAAAFARTTSDPSGLNDSFSTATGFASSSSDNSGLDDSATFNAAFSRLDAATSAEASALAATATSADIGGSSEAAAIAAIGSAADAATATEAAAVAVTALTDSGSASDAATLAARTTAADSGAAAESTTVAAVVSASDSGRSDERVSLDFELQPSDSTGISEGTFARSVSLVVTDTAGLLETTLTTGAFILTQADDAGLTDTAVPAAGFVQAATDGTGLADSATRTIDIQLSDAIGPSDTFTISQPGKLFLTISDTLPVADGFTRDVARSLSDLLTVTDIVTATRAYIVGDDAGIGDGSFYHSIIKPPQFDGLMVTALR